jgi:hypothetical protein
MLLTLLNLLTNPTNAINLLNLLYIYHRYVHIHNKYIQDSETHLLERHEAMRDEITQLVAMVQAMRKKLKEKAGQVLVGVGFGRGLGRFRECKGRFRSAEGLRVLRVWEC